MLLEDSHKKILLDLAREVLIASFQGEPNFVERRYQNEYGHISNLCAKLPCFVSLSLKSSHRLRGCTGSLSTSQTLLQNVVAFTQHAAFSDPRFLPLKENEVEEVEIGISVLGPLQRFTKPEEVEIGRHGIVVEQGSRRGVLLAKVAVEYGWSQSEFLKHTCGKANLDPAKWESYELWRFEEISFEEADFTPLSMPS